MSHLFLFFACAVGATPDPVFKKINRWGVSMHYRHAGHPGQTEMLSKGFKMARTDAVWTEVEYGPGKFNFSKYDALVTELEAHGVQPMLILGSWGNPKFYSQGLPHDTHTRQEFVNFCLAMMQHFKGRNVVWELWNEPNLLKPAFPAWTGQQYGLLAVQLGKALTHAGLGDETLVGPAMSGMLRDSSFLEDVFSAGALKYLDAVTVHPYLDTPENAVYGTDTYSGLRSLIKKHGYADKPIVSSEWGWNTCQKPCVKMFGNYGVSESTQAHFLARQWLTNWLHRVPSIFYDFNSDGKHPHSGEDNFGVVRYDYHNESYPYTPKPAYVAAVTLQDLFGSLDDVARVDCCGSGNVVLRASDDQGNVSYAVWESSVPVLSPGLRAPQTDLLVPVSPAGCYDLHDMLGGFQQTKCSTNRRRRAAGDAMHISAGSNPLYLVLGSRPSTPPTPQPSPAPTPAPQPSPAPTPAPPLPTPSPPPSASCTRKEGTDCSGEGDISFVGGVSSADTCCEKCSHVSGCRAFTFRGDRCYFKSSCASYITCSDCVSGVLNSGALDVLV